MADPFVAALVMLLTTLQYIDANVVLAEMVSRERFTVAEIARAVTLVLSAVTFTTGEVGNAVVATLSENSDDALVTESQF